MIQLDLTPEEQQILVDALSAAVSDLGMEITDTDRMDYRVELKKRKEVLSAVLRALQ